MLFEGHPVWYVSSLEEGVSAMVSLSSKGHCFFCVVIGVL